MGNADELKAAAEAEGFTFEDETWMADEDGYIMVYPSILRPAFEVKDFNNKFHNREFTSAVEAVEYAKSLTA